MTLLEVVLAIAVFTFGMLALAHLQSNIGRSSTDSNSRTVAVNIAEEIIERARNWKQLSTDPDNPTVFPNVIYAFDDLTGTMTATVTRGNVDYSVRAEIDDWFHDLDGSPGSSFTQVDQLGTGDPKFKVMEITVEWVSAEFLSGEGTDDSNVGDLGSGSITVTDIISSTPSLGSGKIVAADDGDAEGPPAEHTPGAAPDVVALNLDGTRYKESSSPLPDVIRSGELSETWFDVVTYNLAGDDAEFLRREEFVALSCQCRLQLNAAGNAVGLEPTIWTGSEYKAREPVAKQYGISNSNQQSIYCDVCCRDHHDGASTSADDRYDGASGGPGNHEHYTRSNQGALTLATANDAPYFEACRLVRKDGFFRVAQDLSLEAYHAFPDLYLDGQTGATAYSNYVLSAATDYYEQQISPPAGADFPSAADMNVPFPASDSSDGTDLPTALNSNSQQLRARGIYVDHLGTEAAEVVECMYDGGTGPECGAPDATHWLEVYPFFDIQMTFLADWEEDSGQDPVSITNEPVETDNSHSKGLARLETTAGSLVTVTTTARNGNTGLSVTDPVRPAQATDVSDYVLYIDANGSGPPSPPSGWFINGDIVSAVGGVQASEAALTSSPGVVCSRTGNSFSCVWETGISGPQTLTLSGYYRNAGTNLWACTNNASLSNPVYVQTIPKSTTWTLPNPMTADINGLVLTIRSSACTPP